MAEQAGADPDMVVAGLCHDMGKIISNANHPAIAAEMIRPWVSEEAYWVVKVHQDFTGNPDLVIHALRMLRKEGAHARLLLLTGRTIDAAAAHGAAIAALAAHDTVKRAKTAGGGHVVVETIPRDTIFLAQTPQGFRRDVLAAAIAVGRSGVDATDEAALAERAGYEVHLVAGDAGNVKVTTEEDFAAARRRMEGQVPPGRVGTGYDLHRLVTGRPLVIGGTTIPFDRGPLGHSDGDVVCHAIIDAVLGAASLGDIGVHFPDSDPAWKDASSVELLRRAAAMAAERRFEIVNVDVTVILEQPRLRGHIDRMRASIAGALGIDPERVSVKGKTNEGVDAIGRGEAIAAHAVALLK